MLFGIHVEGNDHLVVKTLLARLLDFDESAITVDHIDHPGMGWKAVLEQAPKALQRFYHKCCALAVLGMDNDGNRDLLADGLRQDPDHPRHWLHPQTPVTDQEACRYCKLTSIADRVRTELTYIPKKPGSTWPILICVPVEMIESWLLTAKALAQPGQGSLNAENKRRSTQKQALYGRPESTREDVETIALPLLRVLSHEQLRQIRSHSRSFDSFATQVDGARGLVTGECWV